ncbi:MAG: type transport system permease protein [Streptosporangiaceae bacterium]|jgi:ABC-2 type transport system permease protein|nr:type transport system permease protein [Streptosporangiaceae bacterium]
MTTSPPTRRPSPSAIDAPLPSVLSTGLARGQVELKTFFRERETVVLIFALPAVLLVMLGAIFGGRAAPAAGVTVGQLFVAGMIAGGIMSTSFQYLGIAIAAERDQGTLKRLYGTPLPHTAYFIGKIVQVFVCMMAEIAVLMIVGASFYHLHLPSSAGRWWTFAWVCVLGCGACSLLGIAVSSLPRSARGASPMITLPFLVIEFISGVFIPFNNVPAWLQQVAAAFPLKWMAQGLRSVFLPAGAAVLEPAHSWEHGRVALVLTVWIAAGLVLCVRAFRWQSRRG